MNQGDGIQSVIFSLNQQMYCVLIEEIVEILRVPVITTVPGISSYIEGVINLRGNIIPVVCLHKRLKLEKPQKNKKNRIVIVQVHNEQIGIIVDDVRMVSKFDEDHVEPPNHQSISEDIFLGFAKLDGQVIGILNLKKLLYANEILV